MGLPLRSAAALGRGSQWYRRAVVQCVPPPLWRRLDFAASAVHRGKRAAIVISLMAGVGGSLLGLLAACADAKLAVAGVIALDGDADRLKAMPQLLRHAGIAPAGACCLLAPALICDTYLVPHGNVLLWLARCVKRVLAARGLTRDQVHVHLDGSPSCLGCSCAHGRENGATPAARKKTIAKKTLASMREVAYVEEIALDAVDQAIADSFSLEESASTAGNRGEQIEAVTDRSVSRK